MSTKPVTPIQASNGQGRAAEVSTSNYIDAETLILNRRWSETENEDEQQHSRDALAAFV